MVVPTCHRCSLKNWWELCYLLVMKGVVAWYQFLDRAGWVMFHPEPRPLQFLDRAG